MSNGGYVPSAAAMGNAGGYTPSTAATGSGYAPSAAASAGGYTPSAAALGGSSGYNPSPAASTTDYNTASTAGGYTPSAAASGNSGGYTPSASATSYSTNTSSSAGGYVPSAAALSLNSNSYTPSAAPAPAPTPPFSQALNVPPPVVGNSGGYTPSSAASGGGYNTSSTAGGYVPSATGSGGVAPATRAPALPGASAPPAYKDPNSYGATPYATATALTSSYDHGGGPTNGVVTQQHDPIKCHKVDYEIKGAEMQLVEIHLDPQETVVAEAGAMMYLEDDVDFKTKFGDGSEPKQGFFKKIMAGAGRLMTGESLFITHFTNTGNSQPRIAAFAAPYPGTILPIDMMELHQRYPSGNPDKPTALICQKDAFLCAAKGTKLESFLHKKLGSGLFGGEGFILQKIKGDGMAFVHAGGHVIKKELKQGQKLRVDTGCLVAYTYPGINNDIQMAPGLKTMFFGGEGLFLATLTADSPQGGTVWLQSLPFSRFCDRVVANSPALGGKRTGEGSRITGGFGDMIDGDGFSGFPKF